MCRDTRAADIHLSIPQDDKGLIFENLAGDEDVEHEISCIFIKRASTIYGDKNKNCKFKS